MIMFSKRSFVHTRSMSLIQVAVDVIQGLLACSISTLATSSFADAALQSCRLACGSRFCYGAAAEGSDRAHSSAILQLREFLPRFMTSLNQWGQKPSKNWECTIFSSKTGRNGGESLPLACAKSLAGISLEVLQGLR